MPTNRTWLDTNGTYNNTANWSGATVPEAGDSLTIDRGSQTVAGYDASAVNQANVYFGPSWSGKWGSAASAVMFGSLTGGIRCETPEGSEVHVECDDCPVLEILSCASSAYGFHLRDGHVDEAIVLGGKGVRIGAAADVDDLAVLFKSSVTGDAVVTVEKGATIDNVYIAGGQTLLSGTVATTINVWGGTLLINGVAGDDANLPTVNVYGGYVDWRGLYGGTCTAINVYGGEFTAMNDRRPKTVTNSKVYGSGKLWLPNGFTMTNPTKVYGARNVRSPSVSVVVPPSQL